MSDKSIEVGVLLMLILFGYALISFIAGDLNPYNWHVTGRIALAVYTFWITVNIITTKKPGGG